MSNKTKVTRRWQPGAAVAFAGVVASSSLVGAHPAAADPVQSAPRTDVPLDSAGNPVEGVEMIRVTVSEVAMTTSGQVLSRTSEVVADVPEAEFDGVSSVDTRKQRGFRGGKELSGTSTASGCKDVTVGVEFYKDYPSPIPDVHYWNYQQDKHFCHNRDARRVYNVEFQGRFTAVDSFWLPSGTERRYSYWFEWQANYKNSGHYSRTQELIENRVGGFTVSSKNPEAWIKARSNGRYEWDADTN